MRLNLIHRETVVIRSSAEVSHLTPEPVKSTCRTSFLSSTFDSHSGRACLADGPPNEIGPWARGLGPGKAPRVLSFVFRRREKRWMKNPPVRSSPDEQRKVQMKGK